MPSPKLNITLLEVLEMYEEDKDTFPLHRFYTKLTSPLAKCLYKSYFISYDFINKDFKDDKNANRFLKYLYSDVITHGFKRFLDDIKLPAENFYNFHRRIMGGHAAVSLVYILAMVSALEQFSKEAVSDNINVEFAQHLHNRGNLYRVLNVLLKATIKVPITSLCSDISIASCSRSTVEKIIKKEARNKQDSLIFIDETENIDFIGLKGREYGAASAKA